MQAVFITFELKDSGQRADGKIALSTFILQVYKMANS